MSDDIGLSAFVLVTIRANPWLSNNPQMNADVRRLKTLKLWNRLPPKRRVSGHYPCQSVLIRGFHTLSVDSA
jgi:hypothetical protein